MHLVLDSLFIMVFHWDLVGAALAVVISQYIASLSLLYMIMKDGIFNLKDLGRLPDFAKIFDYCDLPTPCDASLIAQASPCRLALASSTCTSTASRRYSHVSAVSAGSQLLVRTISMQTFYTVMTSYGARMGTAVIAAHAIARQCASLEALIVDGLAVATQALVAMYLGQGQRQTARRLCSRLLFLGGIAGAGLGSILFLCSNPIARAFSNDPSVIYEATRALPLVAAVQLPAALAYIYDGIFLGARDFKFLGIAMFFCMLPAMATLIFTAHMFDLGLVTLWLASG